MYLQQVLSRPVHGKGQSRVELRTSSPTKIADIVAVLDTTEQSLKTISLIPDGGGDAAG
jgi:hypothetical protein